jgi:adenine/guanine phosphoribosyltransferase-like PRPP-binding protein
MLSFFRSIRRSLISEGKTSKYIRYAVREFLLIVAGILVALQVSDWNGRRKLEQGRS